MNKTNHPSTPVADKRTLSRLYVSELKSTYEIAKILGVTQTLVVNALHRNGIPTRSYAESSKITRNGFKEGKAHHKWAGDNVSYSALHTWVTRHKGSPRKCEHCGTDAPRKYEWANVSKKYLRNLEDWVRLCTPCHRKFDNSTQ